MDNSFFKEWSTPFQTPPFEEIKLEHYLPAFEEGIKLQKAEVDKIIKSAEEEIKIPLSPTALRLFGAALYWAEGSKGKRFEITNSDPYLILFMAKWLKRVFGIDGINLKARLNIYPQQNEREIKRFWSALTGIPAASFGKSYIKPLSKNYKKNNLFISLILLSAISINSSSEIFSLEFALILHSFFI